MWFPLRSVELGYAAEAPFHVHNEALLPAPPERV